MIPCKIDVLCTQEGHVAATETDQRAFKEKMRLLNSEEKADRECTGRDHFYAKVSKPSSLVEKQRRLAYRRVGMAGAGL